MSEMDNLLKEESEYYFLFKQLHNLANNESRDQSTENFFHYPNIARKFLELFLGFKVPYKDSLHDKIEEIKASGKLSRSLEKKMPGLERLVQVNSHSGDQGKTVGIDHSVIENAPEHVNDLLNFVEKVDEEHFKGIKAKCFNPSCKFQDAMP